MSDEAIEDTLEKVLICERINFDFISVMIMISFKSYNWGLECPSGCKIACLYQ